jgi:hypothetical protein
LSRFEQAGFAGVRCSQPVPGVAGTQGCRRRVRRDPAGRRGVGRRCRTRAASVVGQRYGHRSDRYQTTPVVNRKVPVPIGIRARPRSFRGIEHNGFLNVPRTDVCRRFGILHMKGATPQVTAFNRRFHGSPFWVCRFTCPLCARCSAAFGPPPCRLDVGPPRRSTFVGPGPVARSLALTGLIRGHQQVAGVPVGPLGPWPMTGTAGQRGDKFARAARPGRPATVAGLGTGGRQTCNRGPKRPLPVAHTATPPPGSRCRRFVHEALSSSTGVLLSKCWAKRSARPTQSRPPLATDRGPRTMCPPPLGGSSCTEGSPTTVAAR